jgi:hypothetical protein
MSTMKLEARTCGLEARPSDAMTIKNVPVLKQENLGTIRAVEGPRVAEAEVVELPGDGLTASSTRCYVRGHDA